MLRFAEKLKFTELRVSDFRETFRLVGPGDVVYCDPPYTPVGDNGFTEYSGFSFSAEDHRDLAELAINAAERNAVVLVSNHDTPVTRSLYKDAERIVPLLVSRTISCDGENRNKARELIAVFRTNDEYSRRTS
jgi:DNA adenine methylase